MLSNTTDFSRAATQTKMLFVNFAYTGCKPCHDLMPHWSEAGLAMLNQTPPVIFSQVDVKSDGGSKLGALYGVEKTPALLLFINGRKVGEFSGAHDVPSLLRYLRIHAYPPVRELVSYAEMRAFAEGATAPVQLIGQFREEFGLKGAMFRDAVEAHIKASTYPMEAGQLHASIAKKSMVVVRRDLSAQQHEADASKYWHSDRAGVQQKAFEGPWTQQALYRFITFNSRPLVQEIESKQRLTQFMLPTSNLALLIVRPGGEDKIPAMRKARAPRRPAPAAHPRRRVPRRAPSVRSPRRRSWRRRRRSPRSIMRSL